MAHNGLFVEFDSKLQNQTLLEPFEFFFLSPYQIFGLQESVKKTTQGISKCIYKWLEF